VRTFEKHHYPSEGPSRLAEREGRAHRDQLRYDLSGIVHRIVVLVVFTATVLFCDKTDPQQVRARRKKT
jgi:hypothetical protein